MPEVHLDTFFSLVERETEIVCLGDGKGLDKTRPSRGGKENQP